ncbi:MAG: DnaJ domain-containing protein [Oscillatoriales cyanobacterium RM2_1_1]|nr:DnaJ domain-containing protein [Oscillatoriales cyanobacterium SM2_3_0]NJO47898.1 DnaJ domain-containing protein [Oscillatoriales cyanobacterium RM2_1_1]
MSFEVKQGLFQLGFTDSHAILGVPLNAEFNEIRKRYTRIARRLHPDTCPLQDPGERELAKQLLAKLVSPAYNRFSKESERKEYALLLKTIGDRAVKERQNLQIQSETAKQLVRAQDYQKTYETLVQQLAQKQFDTPSQVLAVTGEISQLNLAYLLRSSRGGAASMAQAQSKPASSAPAATTPAATTSAATTPSARPPKESFVDQACRRAEQLITTQNYSQAALELKDAIKREPENSRCHGLLGLAYLRQNQPKMASPHIKRALSLDPQQPQALEVKKELDKLAGSSSSKATGKKTQPKSSNGGLFGGLFGGKKK